MTKAFLDDQKASPKVFRLAALFFVLLPCFLLLSSCQRCDSQNAPVAPSSPDPSASLSAPTEEDLAWCKQFKPPWGTQVWQEWWQENPEEGERWFTETPEKMKALDLSRLSRCTHLDDMILAFVPLTDLNPLKDLINLRRLDIRFATGVSDLSPLSGLHNLEFLGIWSTSVSDLSPLVGLNKLREINARVTQITDLTPLTKMQSFEIIDLLRTPVSDLSPLAQISRVTDIMACSTQVVDLSPLYPVAERITYLDLCQTPFRAFSDLVKFRNLKTLKLWGLPLGDIGWLSGENFPHLEELDLSGAEVASLKPVMSLHTLKALQLLNTKVNEAELRELQQALPNLDILTEVP